MRIPKNGVKATYRVLYTTLLTVTATVFAPSLLNFCSLFSTTNSTTKLWAQTSAHGRSQADQLFEQGIRQYRLHQLEAALQSWQQALVIYREIKDQESEEKALSNLGLTYYSLGNYIKAIEYHQQSLVISRVIKDRQSEGQSLSNLGNAYQALGDYDRAIEYYQQHLALAKGIEDRKGEGISLSNLGVAYFSLGDYAKAINSYQQSLAIAKTIKNRKGEGQSLTNLGNVYQALGDYDQAIEYYQQSLAIKEEIKDFQGEGTSLGNLGNIYGALGDYPKAIMYYQQHLKVARYIKDREGEAAALGNLGNAYNALGNYVKAIDYQQQSLAIANVTKNRQAEEQSLSNLANAYLAMGDYAKAINYQQQSLAIAKEIGDKDGEGKTLNNLGFALFKQGNLKQAERVLRSGIEAREFLRAKLGNHDAFKISIFEEQARTYRLLQQVLIAQNQPNAALEIAERGRAKAFVELLATRLSSSQFSRLASSNLTTSITPPTIEQIQQVAKEHSATLVEYSIIYENLKINTKEEPRESELFVWIIQPTGEVAFRQVDLKSIWQQQHNSSLKELSINSSIFSGPNANMDAIARKQLWRLLIQPITDLLPKDPNARVIFIPQASLFLVPFAALQDTNNKYLIEQHTILTSPAVQVLELTHQQREKVRQAALKQLVVVGNPTMPSFSSQIGTPSTPLRPLPMAQEEAEAIAKLLNTTAITGNQATKLAMLQLFTQARLIHLATHGSFDNIPGFSSWIALAPSHSDNGILTSEDIIHLKLNAELIVLSACETGRGKITGDGVIGLSRSLIVAGIPSAIVSLWNVNDSSTKLLMTEFYRNWLVKPDKAQALRQAMLTTMQQYPNPRDWAAFTLIGEPE